MVAFYACRRLPLHPELSPPHVPKTIDAEDAEAAIMNSRVMTHPHRQSNAVIDGAGIHATQN